jgi:AsmA protein
MTTSPPSDFQNYRPTPPGHDGPQPRPAAGRPRRRRRRPPPQQKSSWVGNVLFWLAAVVILLAGGVTAAVFVLSPAEMVRTELIRQVKANTGRTLTISGTPGLTFYPSIGVSLPGVSLSPPPAMAGGPTITAERLQVSVALLPLLSQRAVIERITLVTPVIDLRVDRSGRRSWDFATLRTTPTRLAGLPSAVSGVMPAPHTASDATSDLIPARMLAANPGNGLEMLDKLELRAISITDGIIRYIDERTGNGEILSDVDIQVDGSRISDPITMAGNLTWNRERIAIQLRLETIRALLHGERAKADLSIAGRPIKAKFNGDIVVQPSPGVRGPLQADAASLQTMARWLGTELPNAKPVGGLSLKGNLNATPAVVALNGATVTLGKISANGSISAALAGKRPKISANLKVSQLDIDKLSAHFSGVRPSPRHKPALKSRAGTAGPPKSIEDILRGTQTDNGGAGRFSTQVRGYTQTNGWSRDNIDTAAMQAVDADARLRIDGLRVAGLAIGGTSLRVTLNSGSARADIDDIALYGGRGRGVLTARGSGNGLQVGANVSVEGVAAQPLLKDAADVDMIAGNGRLTAALRGTGRSQQDLMSNLAGNASFVFTDGALIGWNIPQIMRGLQTGRLSNFQKVETAKTDFSELSANFTVSNGIANTQDMRMNSPLLRITGSGNTDIGRRALDMIIRPKLVASLSGQGGPADMTGIEVPVRVKGPWDKPDIAPDLSGVLNNREAVDQAVGAVKKLRDQFKGKKAGEIVKDLLGGGGNNSGNGNAAGALLNQLFKN